MGPLRLERGWIDPADMSVAAAVNQIDAPMSGVTKHHDRGASEVELHHRFADREALERGRGLGDDDWIELARILVAVVLGRRDHVARRFNRSIARRTAIHWRRLMTLE